MNKRILILIPSLKIGGGAERIASNLSLKLSEKYLISIITFFHFKQTYPFKGKFYCFKENLYFGKLLLRPFKIYKIIRSFSPNIILTFMDYTTLWYIFTKLLFRIKIPLIASIRNNPILRYKKENIGYLGRYYNFLIKLLYSTKIVDVIVPVTKKIQVILEKYYQIDKTKLKTIYNGINIEKIKEMAKENINDYEQIFYNNQIIKFITMGRLTEQKGYFNLIKAFSKVKKQVPNSKLFIIGDGKLRNKLMLLIKKEKLNSDIILLGKQKNPFKFIAKSDIFILSSLYEGFPNVIIEAMACELPIISTNCETGPNEILNNGEYGLLTKVNDSEDLAKKMLFLAKDKSLMDYYSKKSLDRAKSFDFLKIIDYWINLIEDYSI